MHRFRKILYAVLAIAAIGCAKRGTISGGAKDTIPPVLEFSIPKNYSTGFKGNEIRLAFDEYVKLKDIDKQLIVSPPLNFAPTVSPTTASRSFKITFRDTLLANTTYSMNFGQSIEDNNESNRLREFRYVFSTGRHIDSLTLSGSIRDAFEIKPDSYVTVMLYEAGDTYNDSIVFKQNPRYVANTLDSAGFRFENLKAGQYKLIALKDNVANYRFDPKSDKIGFKAQTVSVPADTLHVLQIFKQEMPFRALKPTLGQANKLVMGIDGRADSPKVTLRALGDSIPSVTTKLADKDSLLIWYRPLKADSLNVRISQGDYINSFDVKIKPQKQDTLKITSVYSGTLPLREAFKLRASRPIVSIDESLISIQAKDSAWVPFKSLYDTFNMTLTLDFERTPLEAYQIRLLPGALTDFYNVQNDSLSFRIATKNTSEYGNLRLTLENVRQYPLIVELVKPDGKTAAVAHADSAATLIFDHLDPARYTVRIIYDTNSNGRWDSGNFLEGRQPEDVIYVPKEIDVRANWDVDQPVTLP